MSTEQEPVKTNGETAAMDNVAEKKAAILKQVEFYFSDSNLPVDTFLNTLVRQNPEGWVPIAIISNFKRMKEFNDPQLVVEALKESSELLEVSEDNSKVRRKTAVAQSVDYNARSIYAKGFETEPNLQRKLEEYFSTLGQVKSVRLRRDDDKNFKGSVFVEYSSVEEANEIAKKKLEYNGKELLVMTKNDYIESKREKYGSEFGKYKPKASKFDQTQGQKLSKDSMLHFKGIGQDVTTATGLRSKFANMGMTVKYVVFDKAEDQGVAFLQDSTADKMVEKIKANPDGYKIGDATATEYRLPTDEESVTYLAKAEAIKSRASEKRQGGRGGKGNKQNGKGNAKRAVEGGADRPQKQAKTDAEE